MITKIKDSLLNNEGLTTLLFAILVRRLGGRVLIGHFEEVERE